MEDNDKFPRKHELRDAVISALNLLGGKANISEINNKVISILNLPDNIVNLEHPDGLCTLLDYKLRWVRTELKKDGLIENVNRGLWQLK